MLRQPPSGHYSFRRPAMKTFLSLATATSLLLSVGSLANAQHYTQVNLVANTSGIAPVTDPNLVNPWGLSRTSSSPWWVSDNGTGLSTLYNGAGAINPLVVTIPKADPNSKTFPTGTPTGTIANASPTDFLLAANAPADFLFSTIDGTISGWNPAVGIAPGAAAPSTHAVIVVKHTTAPSTPATPAPSSKASVISTQPISIRVLSTSTTTHSTESRCSQAGMSIATRTAATPMTSRLPTIVFPGTTCPSTFRP